MAAGKSTVARLLAQRFARGIYIKADALQRMIVSGGQWVAEPGEPQGAAKAQLLLRLKNVCLLARSFYEAGFTVVMEDIILGERWEQLQEELSGLPFSLVVLAPRLDVVVQQRDKHRGKSPQGEAWATYLDQSLRETIADAGLWLDSSEQTPSQTVEQILQQLGLAAV